MDGNLYNPLINIFLVDKYLLHLSINVEPFFVAKLIELLYYYNMNDKYFYSRRLNFFKLNINNLFKCILNKMENFEKTKLINLNFK